MIGQEYPPPVEGGQGRYMHELSSKLLEEGHDVEIFAHGATTRICEERGAIINRFSTIDVPLLRFLYLGRRICKHLENKDFDVYHVNTAPLAFFLDKRPLVVTAHTTLFGEGKSIGTASGRSIFDNITSISYKQIRFLDKKVYDKARVIFAVNNNIKDELETIYRIRKEKIATIHNGVNTKTFHEMKKKDEIREELGLDSQAVILYVGRLAARKNVSLLIEAMHLLRNERIIALIIGKGPKENALRGLAKNLGLDSKVRFVGYVENRSLVNIYNAADFFVLPSIYEGMPMTLLEAMACGTPTIAANFEGVENIIQNGVNGMILERTSAECLAETIVFLLREPKICRSMSTEAMRGIQGKFSWDKTAEKIIDAYRRL